MRAEGASWVATAAALAVSPAMAIERGRRIGAHNPSVVVRPMPEDPAREALPAGHPQAWTVLTAGTWLDGMPYPQPWQDGVAA
jgi:hypothetical protein